MAIKSILVPIDGSDRSWEALEASLVVARRFNSHITALLVSESALKSATFVNVSSQLKKTVFAEENATLEAKAEEIQKQVESFGRRRNLAWSETPVKDGRVTISFHHELGEVSDVIVRWSRYHDTVVISRPQQPKGKVRRGRIGSTAEAVLMESGKPVMIVPPGWKPRKTRRALVAWNDSLEASKALSMTLPWLAQMQKVTVVVSRQRKDGGELVQRQLAWHDIKADVEILNRRQLSAGARMLKICDRLECDFLVMGGYSQSRIRQRVFGGVTDHVLANAHVITVMVH